jgi:hypothetical protein
LAKNKYFKKIDNEYVFKSVQEFEADTNTTVPPHKKYFILKVIDDLINYYSKCKQREKNPDDKQRLPGFLHFLKGLLRLNPSERWSPSQAKFHPFLTGNTFDPDAGWEPPTSEAALEQLAKLAPIQNTETPIYEKLTKKPTSQESNPESYRPQITHNNADLLNSQANSSKPKSKLKLNPNAKKFTGTEFGVPSIDTQTAKQSYSKGYSSEPNSGTLPHSQNKKSNQNEHQNDSNAQVQPEDDVITIPEFPEDNKKFNSCPKKNAQNQCADSNFNNSFNYNNNYGNYNNYNNYNPNYQQDPNAYQQNYDGNNQNYQPRKRSYSDHEANNIQSKPKPNKNNNNSGSYGYNDSGNNQPGYRKKGY